MKITLLTLFLTCGFINSVSAQYPKHIIQLTNKANTPFSLNAPQQYLSERAIQRRLRYNIPIDSIDLPVTPSYINSIKNAGNITVLSTSKWLNQVLIETTDGEALNKISSLPFVKTVKGIGRRNVNNIGRSKLPKPDSQVNNNRPINTSATVNYDYGSNYNQVHIHEGEFLHNKGFDGRNMQLAVLDAGFFQYKSITAFDSLRQNKQVLGERDFVAFDNSVNEDDSHGMYCLSTMAANWPGRMVGTAPKANYWLIRTENATSEYPIEEHNWVAGAEFADSTGSDMISSSVGYYDFDDPAFNHSYNDFYKNATIVTNGAAIAVRKGMIVMNSAGNEGEKGWKYLIFPADADSVCAVGAVNSAGVIAGFSSYGYPGKVKPNIVSVGAGTVVAGLNNQPSASNGTSFSNPNVAGLIACLWQAFPAFNNMKILDAVYKSSHKYNSPDNRYGFGIPNFRIAYRSLKHDENINLYGNDWLFATPDPFSDKIDVRFIGQADGSAKLDLLNASGQVVATNSFSSEKEEVYNYTFSNLSPVPAGFYFVRYADSATTRTIPLQKGNIFEKDWIVIAPNPFKNDLIVYLKAPETGEINLRLIDAKGSVLKIITRQLVQNQPTTIPFNNLLNIPSGAYFLQYISKSQKRTIRLMKR